MTYLENTSSRKRVSEWKSINIELQYSNSSHNNKQLKMKHLNLVLKYKNEFFLKINECY